MTILDNLDKKYDFTSNGLLLSNGLQIISSSLFFYTVGNLATSAADARTTRVISTLNFSTEAFDVLQYFFPAIQVLSGLLVAYLFRKRAFSLARGYLVLHGILNIFTFLIFVYFLSDYLYNTGSSGPCKFYKYDPKCSVYNSDAFLVAFYTGAMSLWAIFSLLCGALMSKFQRERQLLRSEKIRN
jgi:hypothetical protein